MNSSGSTFWEQRGMKADTNGGSYQNSCQDEHQHDGLRKLLIWNNIAAIDLLPVVLGQNSGKYC